MRFTLACLLLAALQAAAPPPRIVISVGTLIDGRGGVTRNTRLVIQDGKIAAIDANAGPIDIDLRAQTLMPGWIDTHVHLNWHFDEQGKSVSGGEPPAQAALFTAEDAWVTLQGGFTTVQSVGAAIDGPVRDRIDHGSLPGPRILTSLRQITNRSGDPDALRALVRQTKQEGADLIKLFATSGLGAGGEQTMTDAADRGRLLGGEGAGPSLRRPRDRRQGRAGVGAGRLHGDRARAVRHRRDARPHGAARHLFRPQPARAAQLSRQPRGVPVLHARDAGHHPAGHSADGRRAAPGARAPREDRVRHRCRRRLARPQRGGIRLSGDGSRRDADGRVDVGRRRCRPPRSAWAIASARSRSATTPISSRPTAIRSTTSPRSAASGSS